MIDIRLRDVNCALGLCLWCSAMNVSIIAEGGTKCAGANLRVILFFLKWEFDSKLFSALGDVIQFYIETDYRE